MAHKHMKLTMFSLRCRFLQARLQLHFRNGMCVSLAALFLKMLGIPLVSSLGHLVTAASRWNGGTFYPSGLPVELGHKHWHTKLVRLLAASILNLRSRQAILTVSHKNRMNTSGARTPFRRLFPMRPCLPLHRRGPFALRLLPSQRSVPVQTAQVLGPRRLGL
jgi:hypothetical protein